MEYGMRVQGSRFPSIIYKEVCWQYEIDLFLKQVYAFERWDQINLSVEIKIDVYDIKLLYPVLYNWSCLSQCCTWCSMLSALLCFRDQLMLLSCNCMRREHIVKNKNICHVCHLLYVNFLQWSIHVWELSVIEIVCWSF